MTIDPARCVHSLYVPVSDGVRLAVAVWLPVERIAPFTIHLGEQSPLDLSILPSCTPAPRT